MQRRLLLTGFAALAVSPALAQSSPAPATDAPAASAPAMKMAAPMTMSEAATKHVTDTMKVGALSLLASRIAAPKVKLAMLKQFTGFEIAEQETIASILKAMMMPGATPSGSVTSPTEAELTAALDDKGRHTVAMLREAKPDSGFERDYVKAQIEGHGMLLDIQEAYLKAPDNAEETAVAKLAKGMIQEHLTLLSDIEKQLKA